MFPADPSGDELKRIMMMNGGTYHHYFNSRKTTHIIATNLPDSKVKALKGDEPICHPDWIKRSLEEGRLLDFRKFLLYSSESKTQPKIRFKAAAASPSSSSAGAIKSAAAADASSPAMPAPTPHATTIPLTVSPATENNSAAATLVPSATVSAAQARTPTPPSSTGGGGAFAKDASDANFLGEFYSNSRLHHISSMGASFKRYVAELREKSDGSFPGREELARWAAAKAAAAEGKRRGEFRRGDGKRVLMHIDMDCFFVSVGLRK